MAWPQKSIPVLSKPDGQDNQWYDIAHDLNDCTKEFIDLVHHAWHHSPYLRTLITKLPSQLLTLHECGPETSLAAILGQLETPCDEQDLSQFLRVAKARLSLVLALADIACALSVDEITRYLSDFADLALQLSLKSSLQLLVRERQIDATCLAQDCGIFILSLGKHGGRELNYSSDVDIIILYDLNKMQPKLPDCIVASMTKFSRNLIALMEQRTKDGYVFRVDPRLRPDPASTPLAVNVHMAEHYYETIGRNWERAAFIKARYVAGDETAANIFMAHIRPFIWRRSLDYAGIDEIGHMTSQLHTQHDNAITTDQSAMLGLNLKWASGCIRQIEIFCQQNQLLWGGRMTQLRTSGTLPTLRALAEAQLIENADCDLLCNAYRRYRTYEHRIQMIDDQQTQKLPRNAENLQGLANFLFTNVPDFEKNIATLRAGVMGTVEKFTRHNNAHEQDEFDQLAHNVLASAEISPHILEQMVANGFVDTKRSTKDLHGLLHGNYRAVRSKQGRELLDKLLPELLRAFSQTPHANDSLSAFVNFVSQLPTGVQLFALLDAHHDLLRWLIIILTDAPAVGERLIKKPDLLENLIAPPNLNDKDCALIITNALIEHASGDLDLQLSIETITNDINDWELQINAQLLSSRISSERASFLRSQLATQAVKIIIAATVRDYQPHQAEIGLQGLGVIAFGRLGSETMLFGSDLDLVFVYDENHQGLDVEASLYFGRVFQRIARNIGMPNAAGRLFELDSRLRPTSTKSSLATSLERFRDYYQGAEKWTWERMALLQTRVIYGNEALQNTIDSLTKDIIAQPVNHEILQQDMIEMRSRWIDHHKPRNQVDLKYISGGIMDVAYLREYLALAHFNKHQSGNLPAYGKIFGWAQAHGYLAHDDCQRLEAAHTLYQQVMSAARLTTAMKHADVAAISNSQKHVICAITQHGNLVQLLENLQNHRARVGTIANRIIPGLLPNDQ